MSTDATEPTTPDALGGGASRRGAAIVLAAIVVALAVFFYVIATAPKGAPAEGTLPVNPVGYMVPDLRLPRLDGEGDLNLHQFLGQPLVINFWASWCVTCKDEAAILGEAERAWRDQGVVFIGIDQRDKPEAARAFERRYRMEYLSLVDAAGVVGPNWGVTGLPETFFVGRDGRIVSKYISNIDAETLDSRIRELLGG